MKNLFGLLLAMALAAGHCYPGHPTSECGDADFGGLLSAPVTNGPMRPPSKGRPRRSVNSHRSRVHDYATILVTAYPDNGERARALNDGVVCLPS